MVLKKHIGHFWIVFIGKQCILSSSKYGKENFICFSVLQMIGAIGLKEHCFRWALVLLCGRLSHVSGLENAARHLS